MIRMFRLFVSGLLLAVPTVVSAIGLGAIELRSMLNQPLDALVRLNDVTAVDADGIVASVASAERYAAVGLERDDYLRSVRIDVTRQGNAAVLRIRSDQPLREPVLDLIIQVRQARQTVQRQYTMLIDPPEFASSRSAPEAPAVAPRPAPASPATSTQSAASTADSSATPTPTPVPTADTTTPQAEASNSPSAAPQRLADNNSPTRRAPEPQTRASASRNEAPLFFGESESESESESEATRQLDPELLRAIERRPARAAADAAPASAPPRRQPNAEGVYVVRAGETLWRVAANTRPDAPAVSMDQMMLAIVRANPRAFVNGDARALQRGAQLRIPSGADARTVSVAEATRRMQALTRGETRTTQLAALPASTPATAGTEAQPQQSADAAATDRDASAAASRSAAPSAPSDPSDATAVATDSLAADDDAARVSDADPGSASGTDDTESGPAAVAPDASTGSGPDLADDEDQTQSRPEDAVDPAAAVADPQSGTASDMPLGADSESSPDATTAADDGVGAGAAGEADTAEDRVASDDGVAAGAPASSDTESGGLGLFGWLVVFGAVLLVIAAALAIRRRQNEAGSSDMAVPVAASSSATMPVTVTSAAEESGQPEGLDENELSADDDDIDRFRAEEEDARTQNAFGLDDIDEGQQPAGASTGVASALSGAAAAPASEEDGFEDPIEDANFRLAYGLYDDAADRLRAAIAADPDNAALRMKLAEVFAKAERREAFLEAADAAAGCSLDETQQQNLAALARDIAPDSRHAQVAAVSAMSAAAAAVALDDSEDLVAEPVSADPGDDSSGNDLLDFDLDSLEPADGDADAEAPIDVGDPAPSAGREADANTLDFNLDELGGDDDFTAGSEEDRAIDNGADAQKDSNLLDISLDDFDFEGDDEDTTTAVGGALSLDDGDGDKVDSGSSSDLLDFDIDDASASPADSSKPTEAVSDGDFGNAEGTDAFDIGGLELEPGAEDAGDADDAEAVLGGQLDLARAYIEIGDTDLARTMLGDIVAKGDAAQRDEAQRMLDTLG